MSEATTPMQQQYLRAKAELDDDTILFFRLGDFYEMFAGDALVASRILGLTLTQRNGMPMCGVPYHAAELYLSKLVRAGRKVALFIKKRLKAPMSPSSLPGVFVFPSRVIIFTFALQKSASSMHVKVSYGDPRSR